MLMEQTFGNPVANVEYISVSLAMQEEHVVFDYILSYRNNYWQLLELKLTRSLLW